MIYPTKKLGEVLEKNGIIPAKIKREDYRQSGKYPVVDQGEDLVAGYIDDKAKLYQGSLPVIVFGDHTRIIKYVDFPFAFGADGIKILRPLATLLPKFFYYVLVFNPVRNQGYKRHFSLLTHTKIPIPPLTIQKQIVGKLDKIAEAQKLNDELIQKADELFNSIFYQEFQSKNDKWENIKLEEVCKIIEQKQPKTIFKDSFSYIDIASIDKDRVIKAQIISVKNAPSRARKLVHVNDTIFSTVRPYLKHIAFIPTALGGSIASTGFCVIRPKTDIADPYFINFVVNSDYFVNKILPLQRGASYPAVSDADIYSQKISLPSLKEQKQIVAKLSAVQDYKKQLLEQKTKLKELFDSVLAKSIS